MNEYVCVYMYVCEYIRTNVDVYAFKHICPLLNLSECVYICIRLCNYMFVYVDVCACISACAQVVYISTYSCVYTHV